MILEPIRVTMFPSGEHAKTGRTWTAECEIEGRRFSTSSHTGATCALARQLVEAGIADRPMLVTESGGQFTWPSFHKAALRTYREGNRELGTAGYRKPDFSPWG